MKKILSIATTFSAVFFVACADKEPPVVDPIENPTMDEAPEVEDPNAQSEADPEVQRLEAERAELERLLNELMEKDVYFDYDKSKLTQEARDLLSRVGDILLKSPKFLIVVEGHTDVRGTESYNMSLGSRRAEAVRGYLVDYGVDKGIISTVSYGEEKPKIEGETESAHNANRRAHFQVKVK